MPFTLDQFAQRFPRLYHLTAAMNVEAIEAERCLYPAAETFRQARALAGIRERRYTSRVIELPGGGHRHIRDQAPLFERKAALLGGWTFADLVQDLNERVYFWPGREDGPIKSGRNHFARYVKAAEHVQVLVVDTAALFATNATLAPHFCRYNSGSPRPNPASIHPGKGSPRGPETFLPADRFDGTAGSVVEVTFRGTVRMDGLKAEWGRAERWASKLK